MKLAVGEQMLGQDFIVDKISKAAHVLCSVFSFK